MKRTVLSADCFDLGDGGKEKQTTQIQQNQSFSESDCKPVIGQCALQTHSTWGYRPVSRGLILTRP